MGVAEFVCVDSLISNPFSLSLSLSRNKLKASKAPIIYDILRLLHFYCSAWMPNILQFTVPKTFQTMKPRVNINWWIFLKCRHLHYLKCRYFQNLHRIIYVTRKCKRYNCVSFARKKPNGKKLPSTIHNLVGCMSVICVCWS